MFSLNVFSLMDLIFQDLEAQALIDFPLEKRKPKVKNGEEFEIVNVVQKKPDDSTPPEVSAHRPSLSMLSDSQTSINSSKANPKRSSVSRKKAKTMTHLDKRRKLKRDSKKPLTISVSSPRQSHTQSISMSTTPIPTSLDGTGTSNGTASSNSGKECRQSSQILDEGPQASVERRRRSLSKSRDHRSSCSSGGGTGTVSGTGGTSTENEKKSLAKESPFQPKQYRPPPGVNPFKKQNSANAANFKRKAGA